VDQRLKPAVAAGGFEGGQGFPEFDGDFRATEAVRPHSLMPSQDFGDKALDLRTRHPNSIHSATPTSGRPHRENIAGNP
jgi:hypothetical protein